MFDIDMHRYLQVQAHYRNIKYNTYFNNRYTLTQCAQDKLQHFKCLDDDVDVINIIVIFDTI